MIFFSIFTGEKSIHTLSSIQKNHQCRQLFSTSTLLNRGVKHKARESPRKSQAFLKKKKKSPQKYASEDQLSWGGGGCLGVIPILY